MREPLVSILIPFKNTEGFLTECLQSVQEQDLDNWEAIIVDDHSDDGSRKIADLFAASDHRFRVLKNPGQGIIPALQTAYAHCRGSLITRMDSDDIMPAEKLQVLSDSLIAAGPGHLAVGQVRYFSMRGISNGYRRYEAWLNRLTETGGNFSEIYKECPVPSPCWMAFRPDFERCGAFDSDRYPEDYDLCFRFYQGGLQVIPCGKLLHFWRDYDTRTSRTSEHYAQNYFLDIKLDYFLKLNRDAGRKLVLWGAGAKGKQIARSLVGRSLEFRWLCDNPRKIGKKIYGHPLEHYSVLDSVPGAQSIVTVANESAQAAIWEFFKARGQVPMQDYFFFC